jgi:hypothetical protein
VWAFSDESERADRLILAVVIASPGATRRIRTEMRRLLLPGQRRIHTSDESARRRRLLLDTIGQLDDLHATALCLRRPLGVGRVRGRRLVLQVATQLIVTEGVVAWTLDDQDPAQLARDRATIAGALARLRAGTTLSYDHRPNDSDPMLWVADAVCWGVGAGGHWRRRIDAVVRVQEIRP